MAKRSTKSESTRPSVHDSVSSSGEEASERVQRTASDDTCYIGASCVSSLAATNLGPLPGLVYVDVHADSLGSPADEAPPSAMQGLS